MNNTFDHSGWGGGWKARTPDSVVLRIWSVSSEMFLGFAYDNAVHLALNGL